MPFPTAQNMSTNAFRTQIIDYYWPNMGRDLDETVALRSIPNRILLPFDYDEIGSFLTHPSKVERALIPLEREIRAQIVARTRNIANIASMLPLTPAAAKPHTTSRKHGGGANLKSHKLLTNALRKFEAESGFNHEKIQNGTFFDDAKSQGTLFAAAAKSDKTGTLTRVTPKIEEQPGKFREPKLAEFKKVDLPRGAPTVLGDLDALAFNPLLKHGYQFKDVGAGAYHGEFTHRLQWYAIISARNAGVLFLFNSPLEIYKSLGYQVAKAPDTNNGGKIEAGSPQQLWMWQALFDTAENPDRAVALKTVAYKGSHAVYTCPESMNGSLFSAEFLERNRFDENDPSNLWCLRVLLATRWKKRFDESQEGLVAYETGLPKLHHKMEDARTSAVYASASMSKEVKQFKDVQTTKTIFHKVAGSPEKRKEVLTETKRVETGTKSVVQDTPTLNHAGYALAWYLRDDRVT